MLNNASLNAQEKAQISAWNGMGASTSHSPAYAFADNSQVVAFEDTAKYKPQHESFKEKHYLSDEIPGGVETPMLKNPWLVMDEFVK